MLPCIKNCSFHCTTKYCSKCFLVIVRSICVPTLPYFHPKMGWFLNVKHRVSYTTFINNTEANLLHVYSFFVRLREFHSFMQNNIFGRYPSPASSFLLDVGVPCTKYCLPHGRSFDIITQSGRFLAQFFRM